MATRGIISKATLKRWAQEAKDNENSNDDDITDSVWATEPEPVRRKQDLNNDAHRRGYVGSNAWENRRD